jgi:carboxyl-terminal processing protease
MNSDDYKKYKDSLSGAFEGIGVRLKYNSSGRVEIGGVIPNSPAEKQKLYPGLIFDKVDGVSVQSKNAEEITELVRGKEGTKVQIEFIDPSNGQLKKYEIERANIKVESIRIIEKNSDTVVLEVNRFTESTPQIWQQLWDTKINEINSNGYKNVILDLRDNGGGYLSAAIYAAGDFMPNGKLIVTEKTRSGGDKTQVTSNAKQRLSGKNVVILVNENTASASEILAAALRYHNKTKIIGQKTFGKGTVQNIFELSNGGALKITIEYWLMPDGKKLNAENPIVPDQISILNRERQLKGEDNMMEDALEVINKL